MKKIGIIVGNGKLPLYFLERATEIGYDVYPIGLFSSVDEKIKTHSNYKEIHIGAVGEFIGYLDEIGVSDVVMLGKIEKSLIFDNFYENLDYYGREVINRLPDNKDETLLIGVIAYLRLNKINVLPQNHLLKDLVFQEKVYTKLSPSEEDLLTIKMGTKAAKQLSGMDIGQTILAKDRSIVAVEGIEGTDKTIERAGEYAGDGCILVKMSRPNQDMRVDVPTVGIKTIEKLVEIGARGIVGEAKRMLFLDKEECINLADENNMFIIGKKI